MTSKKFLLILIAVICQIFCTFAYASDPANNIAQQERFETNLTGEVFDNQTNLTWQRCSFGQIWDVSVGCKGEIKSFTFDQSQHVPTGIWRLPTHDELSTLIDKNYHNPAVRGDIFPQMDTNHFMYWTSSATNTICSWAVYFGHGLVSPCTPNDALGYVHLVRDGR